jgi:hypothetical protein
LVEARAGRDFITPLPAKMTPAPNFNTVLRELFDLLDMVALTAGINRALRYHALSYLTTREAFMPPIWVEYVWAL